MLNHISVRPLTLCILYVPVSFLQDVAVASHPHAGTDTEYGMKVALFLELHLIPTRGRILFTGHSCFSSSCCISSPRGDGYKVSSIFFLNGFSCISSPRGDGYERAASLRIFFLLHLIPTRGRIRSILVPLWVMMVLHLIPTRGRILIHLATRNTPAALHLIPTRGRIPRAGGELLDVPFVASHPHAGTDT